MSPARRAAPRLGAGAGAFDGAHDAALLFLPEERALAGLRLDPLRLLSALRRTMQAVADFGRVSG